MMSSRRVLLFSLGMALLISGIGILLFFGAQNQADVPPYVWVAAMV